jgi:hypothetical protein
MADFMPDHDLFAIAGRGDGGAWCEHDQTAIGCGDREGARYALGQCERRGAGSDHLFIGCPLDCKVASERMVIPFGWQDPACHVGHGLLRCNRGCEQRSKDGDGWGGAHISPQSRSNGRKQATRLRTILRRAIPAKARTSLEPRGARFLVRRIH